MANLKEIQRFIKEISQTGIFKIDIKTDDLELSVQLKPDNEIRNEPMYIQQPPILQAPAVQIADSLLETEINKETEIIKEEGVYIKSPMVGTFYKRPSPDKPTFVNKGDTVSIGDTVCIIEAMKLFNEIDTEINCQIIKTLVEDGTPVEFDQPLFLVKQTD